MPSLAAAPFRPEALSKDGAAAVYFFRPFIFFTSPCCVCSYISAGFKVIRPTGHRSCALETAREIRTLF